MTCGTFPLQTHKLTESAPSNTCRSVLTSLVTRCPFHGGSYDEDDLLVDEDGEDDVPTHPDDLLVDAVPDADLAQLHLVLLTHLHCLLRKLSQFA